MEEEKLSLRQRKILYMIENRSGYTTSEELAKLFRVSSRTIRNEIKEMNRILAPHHASIISTQSKGFRFQAEDHEAIRAFSRIDTAFLTRAERIRHLAFLLCQSDKPLNLYDLEEEIFVSRTSLLSDIRGLRQKYTHEPPFIRLIQHRDEIAFDQDEYKRRLILLNLFHEDWDYNSEGNAYYGLHFLDKDLLSLLTKYTSAILSLYKIRMDDPTLVALELSLAIMHYRYTEGHQYPEELTVTGGSVTVRSAVDELFRLIEAETGVAYPQSEKDRICEFISNTQITRDESVKKDPPESFNKEEQIIKQYLEIILETYKVDFSPDEEFIDILSVFYRELKNGNSMFSQHQNISAIKELYTAEYELSWLFQKLAPECIDRYLSEDELCTLAICFSGAIRHYLSLHPEKKLKTVLFSHRNMAEAWGLKRRILESLGLYLDITDILPVNDKESFDFHGTDLVLSTVRRSMSDDPELMTVFIDDGSSADNGRTAGEIKLLSFRKIWPVQGDYLEKLLVNAYWHENMEAGEPARIIEHIAGDYVRDRLAEDKHILDILQRENRSSYAMRNGIVLLYSTIPAAETKMSVATLQHRMRWNEFRISTIIMVLFRKEDITQLFHLKVQFCHHDYDTERLQEIKTKEELLPYLISQ